MNTAELLKAEMANELPFTKQELIDKVCSCIKNNGYYAFFHGRSTSLKGNEFNNESIRIVEDWIREEGFRVKCERSYYGVPEYYVTL
jgi:hypothetical protein